MIAASTTESITICSRKHSDLMLLADLRASVILPSSEDVSSEQQPLKDPVHALTIDRPPLRPNSVAKALARLGDIERMVRQVGCEEAKQVLIVDRRPQRGVGDIMDLRGDWHEVVIHSPVRRGVSVEFRTIER